MCDADEVLLQIIKIKWNLNFKKIFDFETDDWQLESCHCYSTKKPALSKVLIFASSNQQLQRQTQENSSSINISFGANLTSLCPIATDSDLNLLTVMSFVLEGFLQFFISLLGIIGKFLATFNFGEEKSRQ